MAERTGAKLNNFMRGELKAPIAGIDRLIEKLRKTAQTLNPQSDTRAELEQSIEELKGLRAALEAQIRGVGQLDV
jgi:DNA anti-recombination protein RmuC